MSISSIMLRALLACVAAVVIAVVVVAVRFDIREHEDAARLKTRTAYWTSTVNAAIKIGEPRKQAEAWLHAQFPAYPGQPAAGRLPRVGDDPNERAISADAETVQSDFPCSFWVIFVDVQYGPDDRVTSRGVSKDGVCL